jgi:LPS export ABC transporter protein LptC
MARTGNQRTKKIKYFLVSFIVLILVGIGTIFFTYRRLSEQPERLLSVIGENVNLSLGSIQHTATRDGIKEWTLEAESARLVETKKHMVLTGLSVVYFTKNNGEVYLTANEGILDTKSNDIEVTGNVVLINEPYELQTTKLNYEHKKQMIHADGHVRIISTTSYLGADAMSFDINTNEVQFTGNVEGIFAEKIKL